MELSDRIAAQLPYLRRYARALTGSQLRGDEYALATLRAILEDRSAFEAGMDVRIGLYKRFHHIWSTADPTTVTPTDPMHIKAHQHLTRLTKNSREALLLNTIEDFSDKDVAVIMDIEEAHVKTLIEKAHLEMSSNLSGRVMIIEDEPIIAADLGVIVEELGHRVIGTARTRKQAVELSSKISPDLILADIQLADNSSGIDAVNEILAELGDIPVIFITAFPERLLTGDRPEPAFLISKPYQEAQIQSAISQAMFFTSTDTLRGQIAD